MPFALTEEELLRVIIRLISSAAGTLGFAIVFKTKPGRLPFAVLVGFLTCAAYEVAWMFGAGELISAIAGAAMTALLSEILARVLRAPAVVFLFAGLIPIVPGRALYYSMYHLIISSPEKAIESVKSALLTAFGIAVGLGITSIIIGVFLQIVKTAKGKRKESSL